VFFFFFFFTAVLGGGNCGIYTGSYNVSNISYLNSPPLLLSPQIPGTVSIGIIFAFTYMCTHYLYHIHPPIPFPAFFPLPLVLPPLFSDFVEEKT
jgi:hypothetical protein